MNTQIIRPPARQKPSGKLFLDSGQLNLVDGVVTNVSLDHIGSNFTDGIENTGTYKITPGIAGLYYVSGQVTFENVVADKYYYAMIKKANGPAVYIAFAQGHSSNTEYLAVPTSTIAYLTETDFLQLVACSHSGDNTVDIKAGEYFTNLMAQRVR